MKAVVIQLPKDALRNLSSSGALPNLGQEVLGATLPFAFRTTSQVMPATIGRRA
jgi:hypothetical protein